MWTAMKQRVGVYNFGEALDENDETLLRRAILSVLSSTPGYTGNYEVVFYNCLDQVAFSEALDRARVESLLAVTGLSTGIIQKSLYFIVLPSESAIAVPLVLELYRRTNCTRWPTIIRRRKWWEFGNETRGYEIIPLGDVVSGEL